MKGFSLNRALGISSTKNKISKATGIPLTQQGRKVEKLTSVSYWLKKI